MNVNQEILLIFHLQPGQKGAPITSAYTASKAAVIGMSESLMLEVRKHNVRVVTLTPSTVATDMAVELNLTDGNPEKVMQAEDLADLMVAQLKLHPRVVLKHAGSVVNKSIINEYWAFEFLCRKLFYLKSIVFIGS